MATVNDKLINQELKYFDKLTQKTQQINQLCEDLESQFTANNKQDYTQYLYEISQEVDSSKTYLQNLGKRIVFLEDVTSRQAKKLLFLKISSVIALLGLWFMFVMNNQPKYDNNQPQKKAESLELIQPKYKNELVTVKRVRLRRASR